MPNLASQDGDFRIDIRLSSPTGDILLKVKRTSTAMDFRGALVSLAYALADEPPSSQAISALVNTRLTNERVQEEIKRFRAAVRPEIARRVHAAAIKDGSFQGARPSLDEATLALILESVRRESTNSVARVSQQFVRTAALTRWLTSKGRLGVADLQRATGASMPTVIAAFRAMRLDGLVSPLGAGWQLADELRWDSVRHMAQAHASERHVIRFPDPTRLWRPPLDMARRLAALQMKGEYLNVDVGGVLGAEVHYPNLDITGAPRLDLCVYDGDVSFVRKLDAGLNKASDLEDRAALVLHLVKNPQREARTPGQLRPASAVDCLADLLEMDLQAEARDFWRALVVKRQTAIEQQEIQG